MTPIRVLLADDQALIRAGFAAIISSSEDMDVVGETIDGSDAVRQARSSRPDVVLMDIRMPGVDGIAACEQITADPGLATVRVLMLTTFEQDDYVVDAMRAGASGFLGKGAAPEELLDAVTALSGSGPAYVFYFIEAMVQAGTAMGLTAEQAHRLAVGTFVGAATLAQRSDEPPQTLRERVTSKGGTTYAALTTLDAREVKASFVEAMLAAQNRARELGDEFGR